MMTENQHYNSESTQCSTRSLATLLIAWVSAAMVASLLLRWKYMWIALAVLTVLFVIACGYTTCTRHRQTQRQIVQEDGINAEQGRRNIQSVYGDMSNLNNNCQQMINEPPPYQPYWITDLPPCYAVAISTNQRQIPSMAATCTDEIHLRIPEPRLSNPPLYSMEIQPDHTLINSTLLPQTIGEHHHSHHYNEHEVGIPTNSLTTSRPSAFVPEISTPSNHNKNRRTINESHLDEVIPSSGTHCLSNFIINTFGRGPRRQVERNNARVINREDDGSQCSRRSVNSHLA